MMVQKLNKIDLEIWRNYIPETLFQCTIFVQI